MRGVDAGRLVAFGSFMKDEVDVRWADGHGDRFVLLSFVFLGGGGTIPMTKYREDLRGSCLGQPSFSHRLSRRLSVSSSKEDGPPRSDPEGGLFHFGETATGSALGVSQRCRGLSGAPGAEAAGDYT